MNTEAYPSLITLSALITWGCGGVPQAPPPQAPPTQVAVAPAAEEPEALPARDFGRVTAPNTPLSIAVPDVGGWQRGATLGEWLSLEHHASDSSLELRVWRGGRRAQLAPCAEQLALWRRHIAELAEDERVSSERVALPHGFDAQLSVFVRPVGTEAVEGHLIVVGARPSRCLAVVFRSVAAGPSASQQVAERLRLVTDAVLPSLELQSVEDRATRAPPR